MNWALDYLGRPWANGAQGPDAFDCWGLVRAVYADRYGVELPVVDVDAHAPLAVRHAFAEHAERRRFRQVPLEDAIEGDVVLMSQAQRPHHVGLWLAADGGGVLHAVEGAGVVFQRASSLFHHGWNLVAVYRRLP